jgi:hypothetical protein
MDSEQAWSSLYLALSAPAAAAADDDDDNNGDGC